MISLFACTALASSLAASLLISDTTTPSAQTLPVTNAQTTVVENGLIAPQTYEEYLVLDKPSGVAVCESYTAIADGNILYIFDRSANAYKTYVHGNGSAQDDVKKMQFWGGNILYFADNSTGNNFYKLNVTTMEQAIEIPDIACGTFLINGENLYFTNPSGSLYATTLQDAENDLPKHSLDLTDVSALAYFNDELYFVQSKFYLHKTSAQQSATPAKFLTKIAQGVSSMTIADGVLAYASAENAFYAYALADVSSTSDVSNATALFTTENIGYTSVYPFGNYVYTVRTNAGIVQEYSIPDKRFTQYEISSDSPAAHRLSGSTDVALFEDTLWIADNGNERISAYDTKTQTLSAQFPLAAPAYYLSTDGDAILTASSTQAVLYSMTGETLASFNAFNGFIQGIASVYGTHYIVTENNYFYAIEQTEENVWQRTEVKKTSTHPPQMLTADVYGNLYIKSGAYAYVFTEETFMQADGNGEKRLENLPTDTVKLAVDYDGNIYALGNDLRKYEKRANGEYTLQRVNVDESFVYGDTPKHTSLAFGIEKNVTYLLCDGNYLVQTKNLQLPTVTNIPVEDIDKNVFAETEAEFAVVKTKPKTLFIAFDVERLKDAEMFPYLHYLRSEEEKTALKIGEDAQGKYNLIAHFDENTSEYSTYLVLQSACETLSGEDYRVDYANDEQVSAWLTNSLSLYKFPYLCKQLVVTQSLPRGAEVTLLGEIGELDHEYYRIAYTDSEGNVKTGYVPKTYATPFDASPKESATGQIGETESNLDSVWRFTYILLGFGAVCILVDFLLLRRKKDD